MKIIIINNKKFLKKVVGLGITFYFLLFTFNLFSQGVGINVLGKGANPTALLDLDATGMKKKGGWLIPRMSTAGRDSITAPIPESLLIYNTDIHCFETYYNGWIPFGCLGNCPEVPSSPTAGINNVSQTFIVWNWSDATPNVSYKWGTSNVYSAATDIGSSTSYKEKGLAFSTTYSLYVWAYNACGNSSYSILTQTTSPWNACGTPFPDNRDGQSYKTVKIGSQCWFVQNLNYGTQVPSDSTIWRTQHMTSEQKWCYNDDAANCKLYGGMYQYYNALGTAYGTKGVNCDPCGPSLKHGGIQGMCPSGWHIPSHFEWVTLMLSVCAMNPVGTNCSNTFLYDSTVTPGSCCNYGTTEGKKLKATLSNNPQWDGTNISGFTALPGGYNPNPSFNAYFNLGSEGFFITATGDWFIHMETNNGQVSIVANCAPVDGYSARCVQDQ